MVFGGLLILALAQTSIGRIILSPLLLLFLPILISALIKVNKVENQKLAEEKSIGYVRPLPYYKASTHVSIVNNPSSKILEEDFKEIGLLYVLALEIEFAWDGYAISPRIIEVAEMQSTKNKFNLYHVQSAKTKEFFTVSKEEIVQKTLKEAHIAMYLIPIAYTNDYNESGIAYTGHFKRLVANTPNVEAYAPLYAADAQECIIAYVNNQKEWAINWLAQDV